MAIDNGNWGGSAQGIHRGLQRRGLAKHEGLNAGRVQAARLGHSVKRKGFGKCWKIRDIKKNIYGVKKQDDGEIMG